MPEQLLGRKGGACPWNSRAEFLAAESSQRMKQSANLSRRHDRFSSRLPGGTAAARRCRKCSRPRPPAERAKIEKQFNRVASSAQGCYALIDYVNFKGEGVLATERYRGRGWGLLQVLEGMSGQRRRSSGERVCRIGSARLARAGGELTAGTKRKALARRLAEPGRHLPRLRLSLGCHPIRPPAQKRKDQNSASFLPRLPGHENESRSRAEIAASRPRIGLRARGIARSVANQSVVCDGAGNFHIATSRGIIHFAGGARLDSLPFDYCDRTALKTFSTTCLALAALAAAIDARAGRRGSTCPSFSRRRQPAQHPR